MRTSTITASAALVAGALANNYNGTVVYTTEVVLAYTTYCPSATQITHGASTYTVTEATTLTITNCPCTVTKPVSSAPVISTPAPVVPTSSAAPVSVSSAAPVSSAPAVSAPASSAAPVPASSAAPVSVPAPVVPAPSASFPVASNSTVPAATGTSAPTPTKSKLPVFTGAANQLAASGASIAGLLGLVAYLL